MQQDYHQTLCCDYTGTAKPLFFISLITTFLTIITFGFYRFWAKTRIRRYLWSAIKPGGDPLEYLGTGLEKLLGFLIAVAFLAIYLGIFQLALSFAGLSLFSTAEDELGTVYQQIAFNATFLALLPFIFYAQYRARRYMLSRTRWRGIRFAADKAAWGYVWRAIAHGFLTIITLGILLPRQTFYLEQYKVDRTWYGDTQFRQEGRWQSLYSAMLHPFVAILILLASGGFAYLESIGLASFLAFVGVVWFYFGLVSYSIRSWTILTRNKILGTDVRFESTPATSTVILAYIIGGLGIFIVIILLSLIAAAIIGGFSFSLDAMDAIQSLDPVQIITALISYLVIFGMVGALTNVFILQPILRHYVLQTTIINPEELERIAQREQDDFAEADGFADALDVGAGI